MCLINCIKNDNRHIGMYDIAKLTTYIDASYAVHPNMRGHTGGMMSFSLGVIHSRASKQKVNTKSSTESELVGVSDYLPYTSWL